MVVPVTPPQLTPLRWPRTTPAPQAAHGGRPLATPSAAAGGPEIAALARLLERHGEELLAGGAEAAGAEALAAVAEFVEQYPDAASVIDASPGPARVQSASPTYSVGESLYRKGVEWRAERERRFEAARRERAGSTASGVTAGRMGRRSAQLVDRMQADGQWPPFHQRVEARIRAREAALVEAERERGLEAAVGRDGGMAVPQITAAAAALKREGDISDRLFADAERRRRPEAYPGGSPQRWWTDEQLQAYCRDHPAAEQQVLQRCRPPRQQRREPRRRPPVQDEPPAEAWPEVTPPPQQPRREQVPPPRAAQMPAAHGRPRAPTRTPRPVSSPARPSPAVPSPARRAPPPTAAPITCRPVSPPRPSRAAASPPRPSDAGQAAASPPRPSDAGQAAASPPRRSPPPAAAEPSRRTTPARGRSASVDGRTPGIPVVNQRGGGQRAGDVHERLYAAAQQSRQHRTDLVRQADDDAAELPRHVRRALRRHSASAAAQGWGPEADGLWQRGRRWLEDRERRREDLRRQLREAEDRELAVAARRRVSPPARRRPADAPAGAAADVVVRRLSFGPTGGAMPPSRRSSSAALRRSPSVRSAASAPGAAPAAAHDVTSDEGDGSSTQSPLSCSSSLQASEVADDPHGGFPPPDDAGHSDHHSMPGAGPDPGSGAGPDPGSGAGPDPGSGAGFPATDGAPHTGADDALPADAGHPPDAGHWPPDAGYPPPDAGYPPPDAGYPPPDAGYPPPDAGYPPPDAGCPPPGAGYPAADAHPSRAVFAPRESTPPPPRTLPHPAPGRHRSPGWRTHSPHAVASFKAASRAAAEPERWSDGPAAGPLGEQARREAARGRVVARYMAAEFRSRGLDVPEHLLQQLGEARWARRRQEGPVLRVEAGRGRRDERPAVTRVEQPAAEASPASTRLSRRVESRTPLPQHRPPPSPSPQSMPRRCTPAVATGDLYSATPLPARRQSPAVDATPSPAAAPPSDAGSNILRRHLSACAAALSFHSGSDRAEQLSPAASPSDVGADYYDSPAPSRQQSPTPADPLPDAESVTTSSTHVRLEVEVLTPATPLPPRTTPPSPPGPPASPPSGRAAKPQSAQPSVGRTPQRQPLSTPQQPSGSPPGSPRSSPGASPHRLRTLRTPGSPPHRTASDSAQPGSPPHGSALPGSPPHRPPHDSAQPGSPPGSPPHRPPHGSALPGSPPGSPPHGSALPGSPPHGSALPGSRFTPTSPSTQPVQSPRTAPSAGTMSPDLVPCASPAVGSLTTTRGELSTSLPRHLPSPHRTASPPAAAEADAVVGLKGAGLLRAAAVDHSAQSPPGSPCLAPVLADLLSDTTAAGTPQLPQPAPLPAPAPSLEVARMLEQSAAPTPPTPPQRAPPAPPAAVPPADATPAPPPTRSPGFGQPTRSPGFGQPGAQPAAQRTHAVSPEAADEFVATPPQRVSAVAAAPPLSSPRRGRQRPGQASPPPPPESGPIAGIRSERYEELALQGGEVGLLRMGKNGRVQTGPGVQRGGLYQQHHAQDRNFELTHHGGDPQVLYKVSRLGAQPDGTAPHVPLADGSQPVADFSVADSDELYVPSSAGQWTPAASSPRMHGGRDDDQQLVVEFSDLSPRRAEHQPTRASPGRRRLWRRGGRQLGPEPGTYVRRCGAAAVKAAVPGAWSLARGGVAVVVEVRDRDGAFRLQNPAGDLSDWRADYQQWEPMADQQLELVGVDGGGAATEVVRAARQPRVARGTLITADRDSDDEYSRRETCAASHELGRYVLGLPTSAVAGSPEQGRGHSPSPGGGPSLADLLD